MARFSLPVLFAALVLSSCSRTGNPKADLVQVTINVYDRTTPIAAHLSPGPLLRPLSMAPARKWCASFSENGTPLADEVCSPDGSAQPALLPKDRCLTLDVDLAQDGSVDSSQRFCVTNAKATEVVVYVLDPKSTKSNVILSHPVVHAGSTVRADWSVSFPNPVTVQLRLLPVLQPQHPYWHSSLRSVDGEAKGFETVEIPADIPLTNSNGEASYKVALFVNNVEDSSAALVILAKEEGPQPETTPTIPGADPETTPTTTPVTDPVTASTGPQIGDVAVGCGTVQLTGSGFGTVASPPEVFFDSLLVSLLTISDGGLSFSMPTGASPGDKSIVVSTSAGTTTVQHVTVSDSDWWRSTSETGSPVGRYFHSAVWTGTEMIVWGGKNGSSASLATGGRYNAATDTWLPTQTASAPSARLYHKAVWTGSEMIVWGGIPNESAYTSGYNTGGRYNPATDSWRSISTTGAPVGRYQHVAVWADSEMIVWGGCCTPSLLASGGRYDPVNDTWSALPATNAPTARYDHSAVWTGSEMVVWGGVGANMTVLNTGARWNRAANTWTATASTPVSRYFFSMEWTGSKVLIWGGCSHVVNGGGTCDGLESTGVMYDPAQDTWSVMTNLGAPLPRYYQVSAWSGSELLVWGGYSTATLAGGAAYSPSEDHWRPFCDFNQPTPRFLMTSVWTGNEFMVWGGFSGTYPNGTANVSGGRYKP